MSCASCGINTSSEYHLLDCFIIFFPQLNNLKSLQIFKAKDEKAAIRVEIKRDSKRQNLNVISFRLNFKSEFVIHEMLSEFLRPLGRACSRVVSFQGNSLKY